MVHNHTQGILDLLNNLGKSKVSALASGIVGIMDNENPLRNIVINENMRKALVAMLLKKKAPGNIIVAVLTSTTVALQLIKDLGELNIDRELLDAVVRIVLGKPSISTSEINSLLENVGIDVSNVSSIKEIAVVPANDNIEFSSILVIEGISYDELTDEQKNTLAAAILDSYVESLNLDLEKVAIAVQLFDPNASATANANANASANVRVLNRKLLSRQTAGAAGGSAGGAAAGAGGSAAAGAGGDPPRAGECIRKGRACGLAAGGGSERTASEPFLERGMPRTSEGLVTQRASEPPRSEGLLGPTRIRESRGRSLLVHALHAHRQLMGPRRKVLSLFDDLLVD